eukprot:2465148-Pyramimonas_sp.AAC.1
MLLSRSLLVSFALHVFLFLFLSNRGVTDNFGLRPLCSRGVWSCCSRPRARAAVPKRRPGPPLRARPDAARLTSRRCARRPFVICRLSSAVRSH